MAYILAVLGSPRKHGFTATLLEKAIEGMKAVKPLAPKDNRNDNQSEDNQDIEDNIIDVEVACLVDYSFGPCTSCYYCIRSPEHACSLNDDMGKKGDGALFQKILKANALLLADPVQLWGPSALMHTFIERCYPFSWSGGLRGLPFGSISCASNQGMHRVSRENFCKWGAGRGMRYIGGIAAHLANFPEALREAKLLGRQLAAAALEDAALEGKKRDGRRPFTDEDIFLTYIGREWDLFEHYIDNLTNGTGRWEGSLIQRALAEDTFKDTEARELLEKAGEKLREALYHRQLGDKREAVRSLVKAAAHWTNATWKEFLEKDVVKAEKPAAYRPGT